MSEDIKIHHETRIHEEHARVGSFWTQDWAKVTCGECKLERPMEPLQPEYVVPESVKRSDAFVGAETFLADTLPRAALLQRRLARRRLSKRPRSKS